MDTGFLAAIDSTKKRVGRILKRRFVRKFNFEKKYLIDFVFQRISTEARFADLGGVWSVEGAYSFYALDRYHPSAAFLVDTDFTPNVKHKKEKYKNLSLIQSNFGDSSILKELGQLDVIFLFDVLLHQVKPDWNEILEMYSQNTNYFAIFNPQFIHSERSVRLLDLGVDEYFENVPHDKDHPVYKAFIENLDKIHPQHNRLWRDIHNVWQWGIVDRDLLQKMESLGFVMEFFKNCGPYRKLKNFERHAFIFKKASEKGKKFY